MDMDEGARCALALVLTCIAIGELEAELAALEPCGRPYCYCADRAAEIIGQLEALAVAAALLEAALSWHQAQ